MKLPLIEGKDVIFWWVLHQMFNSAQDQQINPKVLMKFHQSKLLLGCLSPMRNLRRQSINTAICLLLDQIISYGSILRL